MAEPFLAEIRIFSFSFPPKGWALCNGQLLPINQNQALFSLLGTYYGGNGETTFALPDLRGRVPIHMGNGHPMGQGGGSNAVTLTHQEMPQHNHILQAVPASGTTPDPTGNLLAAPRTAMYTNTEPVNLFQLHPSSISVTGGSQPHLNMMPFLTLTFCIALQGIFPSQT